MRLCFVLSFLVLLQIPTPVVARDCIGGAAWAAHVDPIEGVRNLRRVRDKPHAIYRSAQPRNKQSFAVLIDKYKIRSVLSLNEGDSDQERAKGLKLRLHNELMNASDVGWRREVRRETRGKRYYAVVRALKYLRRESMEGAILVHCTQGADRTGLVIALYRVIYENWCKEAAIAEMKKGGFGHKFFFHNIRQFIREVPIHVLRRDVEAQ